MNVVGVFSERVVCVAACSFSVDPRVRHTFWTQTVGLSAVYVGVFSSNQMMVQRYMAVSSVRQAQTYVRQQYTRTPGVGPKGRHPQTCYTNVCRMFSKLLKTFFCA